MCRVCADIFCFIPVMTICVFLVFHFCQFARDLSVLLIFSKKFVCLISLFHWSSLLFLISFVYILIFIISFHLSFSLSFFCSSFISGSLDYSFETFPLSFLYTFSIHFPLNTALAVSCNFWFLYSHFHCFIKKFPLSFFIIHGLFISVLFSFQVFGKFCYLSIIDVHLVLLWLKSILYMT